MAWFKRGLGDEMVVSSYGTVLAICDYPREVLENIERMEKEGIFENMECMNQLIIQKVD